MANKPLKSIKFPGLPDTYTIEGLSSNAKAALLNCFAHVAWIDEHGQDYYDALESALYTDTPTIKLFVGKGTSGASLIDNDKRLLSEPIPFSNESPITIQWEGISGYRYAIKNMISSTVVDTTGTAYYPAQIDYGDDVDAAGAKYETWVITDDLQTKGHTLDAEEQTWEPLYFSNTSGYMRILLANRDALSYDLPSTMPSGYITVQGTKYKIEVKEKNEFI